MFPFKKNVWCNLTLPHILVISCSFVFALGLQGCTPTMNWREARLDNTNLKILLPCKPDKGNKTLMLNGSSTSLEMIGCEAGGVLFAVSKLNLPFGVEPETVLNQWSSSVTSNMKAGESRKSPFQIQGENPTGLGIRLDAIGSGPRGKKITLTAVWFVQDRQLFHAAMYANQLLAEAVETFLSGLSLH